MLTMIDLERAADFIPEVNEAFVKSKCEFLIDTQLWPLSQRLDPFGWLNNFSGRERALAVHLLNSFMYFSNAMIDQLFVAGFRGLSRRIASSGSRTSRIRTWEHFLSDVIVTFPTGEEPNVSDSGYGFARRARDLIGIPEAQLMPPHDALSRLEDDATTHVLFVDDFVGSGSQFVKTWFRCDSISGKSYATRLKRNGRLIYMPLFCTAFAMTETLSSLAREVDFLPVHVLSDRYNALSAESIFWPNGIREEGQNLIRSKSAELGIPDTDGQTPQDWRGFAKLGLGIAFEHQIPDASLPLFYFDKPGWSPLWKRTP